MLQLKHEQTIFGVKYIFNCRTFCSNKILAWKSYTSRFFDKDFLSHRPKKGF